MFWFERRRRSFGHDLLRRQASRDWTAIPRSSPGDVACSTVRPRLIGGDDDESRILQSRGSGSCQRALLTGTSFAADPVPAQGPGWTGTTNPKDVIYTRRGARGRDREADGADRYRRGERRQEPGWIARFGRHHLGDAARRASPVPADDQSLRPESAGSRRRSRCRRSGRISAASTSSPAQPPRPLQRWPTRREQRPCARRAKLRERACDACHALYPRAYEPPKVLDSTATSTSSRR